MKRFSLIALLLGVVCWTVAQAQNRIVDVLANKIIQKYQQSITGPYFHDGSRETLWDVMDHYNKGNGLQNPWLDEDSTARTE